MGLALNRIGFEHIYVAAQSPDFPDYIWTPSGDNAFSRGERLLRSVFSSQRAVRSSQSVSCR